MCALPLCAEARDRTIVRNVLALALPLRVRRSLRVARGQFFVRFRETVTERERFVQFYLKINRNWREGKNLSFS